MENICIFAYIEKDDKVLLVRHAYNECKWHLPGGSVKLGENLKNALIRECKEETGLDVKLEGLKGIIYSTNHYTVAFIYRASVIGGMIRKNFDREIMSIGFFGINSLPESISDYAMHRILLFRRLGLILEEWDPIT